MCRCLFIYYMRVFMLTCVYLRLGQNSDAAAGRMMEEKFFFFCSTFKGIFFPYFKVPEFIRVGLFSYV